MKKFSFILNIVLFLFLSISLFFNISKNNNEKYTLSILEDEYFENLIIFNTKDNTRVLSITYTNNDEIVDVTLEEQNGFYFSIGRTNNETHHYIIYDKSLDYQNLSVYNQPNILTGRMDHNREDVLIDRTERYGTVSKNYKLLNNGNIELLDWDINKEEWIKCNDENL